MPDSDNQWDTRTTMSLASHITTCTKGSACTRQGGCHRCCTHIVNVRPGMSRPSGAGTSRLIDNGANVDSWLAQAEAEVEGTT